MKQEGITPEVRQAASDLLIRYATGIDTRNWDLLRSCFTDDCEADYGDVGQWKGDGWRIARRRSTIVRVCEIP